MILFNKLPRLKGALSQRVCILSLILMIAGGCADAFAQDASPISVILKAAVVKQGGGKEIVEVVEKVQPGDIIQYTAACHNSSPRIITALKPVIPIPAEMEFELGSSNPTALEGSLDGVKFAPLPLERDVKQADGTMKKEAIPAAEYRAIRWSIAELQPGATTEVSLRARMKVAAKVQPTSSK